MKAKETITGFERDCSIPLNINGVDANRGYYNLVISIRDLKLWKAGMRPHRHWRITDVKKYFGISGKVDVLIHTLEHFKENNYK